MSRLRRGARASALAAVLLLWASVAAAHGTSRSYADWVIDGARAELRVTFAAHDLAVPFPALDPERDQRIAAADLKSVRDVIGEQVLAWTRLSASARRDTPATLCRPGAPAISGFGEPLEEIQVRAAFDCGAPIAVLELEARYLPELAPPHLSVATVLAADVTAQHIFTATDPVPFRLELAPASLPEVFAEAARRGARATFSSALVLAFGGLVFSAERRWARRLGAVFAGAVTAFRLAPLAGPSAWAPWAAAVAVSVAGLELLSSAPPSRGRFVRAAAVLVLLAAGLATPRNAEPTMFARAADLLGALAPPLVCFGLARLGARLPFDRRLAGRALGVAAVAGGLAMFVSSWVG